MKKSTFGVCTVLGLFVMGCQPAESPVAVGPKQPPAERAQDDAPDEDESPEVETSQETTPAKAEPERPAPPAPSEEQIAAAKKLAEDLGVRISNNADGQVVGIDTAANRSWVDDYQMQEMLVFPGLTSLTVEGPSITDALAPQIAECRQLTSLALRNTLIGDAGISQLADLKTLKIIDLRVSPMVTDATAAALAGMAELRAVRLLGCNVTDTGISSLMALPRLTELDVRNCRGVTQAGLAQLTKKPSLRVLKIGGPKVDDDALQVVGTLTGLTSLSLDNCGITDAGVPSLGELSLQDLTIYQCSTVTDEGLDVLAKYDRLERLTLRDVPAKGAALAKLPHPEKLVSLNMAQSGIGDEEVGLLAAMTALETLNLSETQISDAAIPALAKLSALKNLVLTQTRVSSEGKQQLISALPSCNVQAD